MAKFCPTLGEPELDHLDLDLGRIAPVLLANRPIALQILKTQGVQKLGQRQKICNALAKAIKNSSAKIKPTPHLTPCLWSQDDATIGIKLTIPKGTPSAKIAFLAHVNSLQLTLDGEETSLVGTLHGVIKAADSTWEIQRAPEEVPSMFNTEISADDLIVVTLQKAHPGEWVGLFASGHGTTAKKEVVTKENVRTRAHKSAPEVSKSVGSGHVGFVPRKLKLKSRKSGKRPSMDNHPTPEVPSEPAKDHWDPYSAQFLWRDGCKNLYGEPDGPTEHVDGPFYSWTETAKDIVLHARTQKGLKMDDVKMITERDSMELYVLDAPTPWCGKFSGIADPDSCGIRVVTEGGFEWDTLECKIVKAFPLRWRAPFEHLLQSIDERDYRRDLPPRQAIVPADGGWEYAQRPASWSVVMPLSWEPPVSLDLDDILVAVTRTSLNVHIAGRPNQPLLGGEMHGVLRPEKSSFSICLSGSEKIRGELRIKLCKDDSSDWPDLFKVMYN